MKSDDHSKTDDLTGVFDDKTNDKLYMYHLISILIFTSHNLKQVITIDELLNMMSVFIEIGEGKGHKVSIFE